MKMKTMRLLVSKSGLYMRCVAPVYFGAHTIDRFSGITVNDLHGHSGFMDLHPSTATAPMLYPSPSEAAVKLQYVGRRIADVQAPAAIVDAAVVRRNCKLMLEATEKLGVAFRAHVKTHKGR